MTDTSDLFCDLSHAPDSPAERLAAYRRLFSALLTRTSLERGLRFGFDAARVDRDLLDRLVALEGACCPFLHSEVSTAVGEVWWDVAVETDEAVPFLDALRDLPETLGAAPAGTETVLPAGVPVRLPAAGPASGS